MRRLHVLGQDEHRNTALPKCKRRVQSLVPEGRRHPDVEQHEIRFMFVNDGAQRCCVRELRHDLMSGVGQQRRQPLTEKGRVLGDHYPHGRTACSVVPAPGGLWRLKVPPCARTRSATPASPVPTGCAPPLPSSVTVTCRAPATSPAESRMWEAPACFTALVTASHATKYAAASTRSGSRWSGNSSSSGTGRPSASSASATASPSSNDDGPSPLASLRSSAMVWPISSTAESSAGATNAACAGSERLTRRSCSPSESSLCCAPSCRSRSTRRRSS